MDRQSTLRVSWAVSLKMNPFVQNFNFSFNDKISCPASLAWSEMSLSKSINILLINEAVSQMDALFKAT